MVEGKVSGAVPASRLQQHPHTCAVVHQWAALELTRIKTPWLVGVRTWGNTWSGGHLCC